MNTKLLRAEWRAVRRASWRLMHNSLSMVGLVSVGVTALVVAHPEYAREVGHWVLPSTVARVPTQTPPVAIASTSASVPSSDPAGPTSSAAPAPTTDPLIGAIVHPSGDAGRLLGLAMPDAATTNVARDPSVTISKVSTATGASAAWPPMSREQRDATTYLSHKYRVSGDAVAMLVDAAYKTGKDLGLDPLLLLSVVGVESGFNPFAESTAGASGLMQLIAKVHRDKLSHFGGANIALNPVVNLRVGAVVLKDCIRRGGSIVDGLRLYVGAGTGDDGGYGSRVLQEKEKLAQAVHDAGRPRAEVPAERRLAAPDGAKAPVKADRTDDKGDERDDGHEADLDHGRFDSGRVAAL